MLASAMMDVLHCFEPSGLKLMDRSPMLRAAVPTSRILTGRPEGEVASWL